MRPSFMPFNPELKRIVIVGNAGAGKTTLARRLALIHRIPVTHVDSIQFLPGMMIRPHHESIARLNEIQAQERWMIEGYGPLDLIEKRFQLADRVIYIDFKLWRHLWWCTKRQIKNLWSPRLELPEGCDEVTFQQTIRLYQSVLREHKKMRPELLRIFARDNLKHKMIFIRTYAQWQRLFRHGIY